MARKPRKPSKPAAPVTDRMDWIWSTVQTGEAYVSKYTQRYDWRALAILAQGLPLTLARLNARACTAQTLRLYRDGGGSDPARKVGHKRLGYMASGRAGRKAAEWATSGGDAQEVTDSPVLRLLNRPNPWYTGREDIELGFVYRQIVGNSFDQVVLDGSEPVALLPMIPWWVSIQADREKFIAGYWYDRARMDGGQWLEPESVVHLMHARSEDDPYSGEGWLNNVRAEAKILATDAGFDIAFAERGYQPPFAIQYDEPFDQGRAKQAIEFLKSTFSGWTKMVLPLLLWKGKYIPTQTTPKDLQNLEKIRERRLSILAAAGVPESMYALNDANLASAQQGYSIQYLDATVRPMCNSHAEQLTERLLPRFGIMPGEMWLAYDNPVPENESADADRMMREVAAGVLTVDEYRAERGLPPMPVPPIRSAFPVVDAKPDPGAPEDAPEADPPAPKALPQRVRKRVDLSAIKSLGWYAGDACCSDHKAAPTELERELAAWYEGIIRSQARTIAAGGVPTIPEGSLESIFRAHLPGILTSVAEAEAADLGAVPNFAADASRAIENYIPELSRHVRQTTAERMAEISQVVGDTLREGIADGASIEQIAEEIGTLAPEEAGYMAERVARTETAYASTQGRMLAYQRAGITEKDWLLAPGACPVCLDLSEKRPRVKTGEPFARAGETFGGYTLKRDCYGPPVHPNDRCSMMAVVEGFVDA